MNKASILFLTLSAFIAGAEPVNLYRTYSSKVSNHFYTADFEEMLRAVDGIYIYEGVAGRCLSTQEAGTVPFYRLFAGGKRSDHFYTTSSQERDLALAHGVYRDEGVACYVYTQQQAGTCPFYRLWNGDDHFYTQSWQEALRASNKYQFEGVAGYFFPASNTCPN